MKTNVIMSKDALSNFLHNLAEDVKNNNVEVADISQDFETTPLISEEGLEITRFRTAKVVKIEIRLVAGEGQELSESYKKQYGL